MYNYIQVTMDVTTDDCTIVCNGFDNILSTTEETTDRISSTTTTSSATTTDTNTIGYLKWYCAPDSWKILQKEVEEEEELSMSLQSTATTTITGQEGSGGKWYVLKQDSAKNHDATATNPSSTLSLVVYPPTKKDYWRKTYYEPLLIKDDGPFLYYEIVDYNTSRMYYTIQTTFTLYAYNQFDQAGLMIRYNNDYWIKTGIEVVDSIPRLSCVVTNIYSDWSTQIYNNNNNNSTNEPNDPNKLPTSSTFETVGTSTTKTTCSIRIHCRGDSFVVEVQDNQTMEWDFVRIAHLTQPLPNTTTTITGESTTTGSTLLAGIYSACPIQQNGQCYVIFSKFSIVQGSTFHHTA